MDMVHFTAVHLSLQPSASHDPSIGIVLPGFSASRVSGRISPLGLDATNALAYRSAHVCGRTLPKSSLIDAVASGNTGDAGLVMKRCRRVYEGIEMWAAWGVSGAAKPPLRRVRRQSQAVSFGQLMQRPAALPCLLRCLLPESWAHGPSGWI
jgi:hypothetical protein